MNHRRRRLDRRRRHLRWLRREYPKRVENASSNVWLGFLCGLYIRRKLQEPSFARIIFGLPQEPMPPLPEPKITLQDIDLRTAVLPDSHPRESGRLWVRGACEIREHAIRTTFEDHKKKGETDG